MNKKSFIQKAGNYADFTSVKTCNLEPNVSEYKTPCGSLTDNQFGLKETVGYYSGGRASKKQNGGCNAAKPDCMGNTIPNMGDMTYLSKASEDAWFYRNTYGAPSSTNVLSQKGGKSKRINRKRKVSKMRLSRKVSNINAQKSKHNQKGGNYVLAVDQPKIGGLSHVQYQDDVYAQYAPNVNSANPIPNLKVVNNNYMKGGSKRNSRYNKKGGQGNFNPDMNTRTFNCKQPFWSENCI